MAYIDDNQVFIKTRELGELITQTSAYEEMRAAEAAVRDNASASEMLTVFSAHQHALEALFGMDDPDPDAIKLHTETMRQLQTQLNDMSVVAEMNSARQSFSGLIQQVNQVLGFIVSGETQASGGCGGSCAGCSGCASRGRS